MSEKQRPYDVPEAIRRAAHCKALRERVGMNQDALARAAGVTVRSVTRWESPEGAGNCPDDVLDLLAAALERQRDVVDVAVSRAIALADSMPSDSMPTIRLLYYPNQSTYDMLHKRDKGYYGIANANARATAQELEAEGFTVEWKYADESDIGQYEYTMV